MPLMPVKINSSASINFAIPIVSALVFSMHHGKLIGPVHGFSTADWDYIRTIAVKRAIAIRSQGFIHPATLVPSELEYAEGYRARMSVLWSKMRPIPGNRTHQSNHQQHYQHPKPQPQPAMPKPSTQMQKHIEQPKLVPKTEQTRSDATPEARTKSKKARKPRKTKSESAKKEEKAKTEASESK